MKFISIIFVLLLVSLVSSNLLYSLVSFQDTLGKQTLNIIKPNSKVISQGIGLDIQFEVISIKVISSESVIILCSDQQTFHLMEYQVPNNKVVYLGSIKSNSPINIPSQQVIFAGKIAYLINNSNSNGIINVTVLNFNKFSSEDIIIQAFGYEMGTQVATGYNQQYNVMFLAYPGIEGSVTTISFNTTVQAPSETVTTTLNIGASSNNVYMIFSDEDNLNNVHLILQNNDGSFSGCLINDEMFGIHCQDEFQQQVFVGQPQLFNPLFLSSDSQSLLFICQSVTNPTVLDLNVYSINNNFTFTTYTIPNIYPDFPAPIDVAFTY
ncbi:hypothetical protein ACTA71_002705 [Dictyostelium dimigraforme]